jgi:antitoxin YefM
MEAVSYSVFRSDLRRYLDKVRDDAEPIIVTSKDPSANVVVLNVADYENLLENDYIRSNDYLMAKIARGREQFAAGAGAVRELIEPADE